MVTESPPATMQKHRRKQYAFSQNPPWVDIGAALPLLPAGLPKSGETHQNSGHNDLCPRVNVE